MPFTPNGLTLAAEAASWHPWALGVLLVVMFGALVWGRIGIDLVMLGVLTVLAVSGILTPREVLAGFANEALASVAMLYVIATGMRETGAVALLSDRILGTPKSIVGAQARMTIPIAAVSAFTNNTTLVASFMPVVSALSKRTRIAASYLFMPLSFATILGGVCTLIGTSTNLVVAGLIQQHNDAIARGVASGQPVEELGMFTLAWVGVPVAVAGIAYMLIFGRFLLPGRGDTQGPLDRARQYMTAMRVEQASPVAGKTIEGAGLRHLPGVFLSRIDREDRTILAPNPKELIRAGDVLIFVGVLSSVVDLARMKGLTPVTDDVGPGASRANLRLVEAVVSGVSPLVGRTVRDAEIRTRYGAVVVAVHRQGYALQGRIGDIELRPGDTLLLETDERFASRYRDSHDFHLVSALEGAAVPRHERAFIAIAILLAMVVVVAVGLMDLLPAAMGAACAMLLTRCCTGPQVRAAMDWTVLIVIGCAFAIGAAMQKTGLAETIAHRVVAVGGSMGHVGIIAVVYALTVVFTMVLSNTAAAALVFPIAVSTAIAQGMTDFTPLAVVIAVAASAEFSTPIGYQTNLMVMGPGGYRWVDYTRFGGPLTLLCGVVAVIATALHWL